MPNTSHAHSLSLSLLSCFGEKLNYNTLLFLTFISSSFLLFLEEKRKKKKKNKPNRHLGTSCYIACIWFPRGGSQTWT